MRGWMKWLLAAACVTAALAWFLPQPAQAQGVRGPVVPVQYYTYYNGYPYYSYYGPAPYYYYSPGYYSYRWPGISVYKAPGYVRPWYYGTPWVVPGSVPAYRYRWWW